MVRVANCGALGLVRYVGKGTGFGSHACGSTGSAGSGCSTTICGDVLAAGTVGSRRRWCCPGVRLRGGRPPGRPEEAAEQQARHRNRPQRKLPDHRGDGHGDEGKDEYAENAPAPTSGLPIVGQRFDPGLVHRQKGVGRFDGQCGVPGLRPGTTGQRIRRAQHANAAGKVSFPSLVDLFVSTDPAGYQNSRPRRHDCRVDQPARPHGTRR